MSDLLQSIFLVLIFFVAGFNKIFNFKATSLGLKSKTNMTFLPNLFFYLAILVAILIEIVAPIFVVTYTINYTSKTLAKISLLALILFTILASLIYHFPGIKSERIPFMKNLAIIGGLWAFYSKL